MQKRVIMVFAKWFKWGARKLLHSLLHFSEWISTVDLKRAIPKEDFMQLINSESDFFLSFNYTNTLEYLYGIKKVCHIHGIQNINEEPIFGHGNDYNNDLDHMDYRDVEGFFEEVHDRLKKDTTKVLETHKAFFETLSSSISKIFSYGFSFSKVDEVYIREICKQLLTEGVTWYLNDYDDDAVRLEFQNIIIQCGFNGSFDTFSVKR